MSMSNIILCTTFLLKIEMLIICLVSSNKQKTNYVFKQWLTHFFPYPNRAFIFCLLSCRIYISLFLLKVRKVEKVKNSVGSKNLIICWALLAFYTILYIFYSRTGQSKGLLCKHRCYWIRQDLYIQKSCPDKCMYLCVFQCVPM